MLTGWNMDEGWRRPRRLVLRPEKEKSAAERAKSWENDPEWVRLRTAILLALEPHNEAREAVLAAVRQINRKE